MSSKILLIGLGGLGKPSVLSLMNEPAVGEILVASRNAAHGEAYCNLVRLTGAAAGWFPRVEFIPLDLNQPANTAEVVATHAPDLILTTATMMPWWLPDRLPPEQAELFQRAGFGVWLPVHLHLTIKLMEALRLAAYSGPVLTAPFPDVVNPILASLDLAPTCGIGNLAEIVPKIRLLAASRLDTPPENVNVTMVAHHALEKFVFRANPDPEGKTAAPPYFLEIIYQGRSVVDELEADQLLFSAFPLPSGQDSHVLTVSAGMTAIRALLSRGGARVHVPGPLGLPGGYPVVASRSGVSLALPAGLTMDQAVRINTASHRFDGIERILPDGAVEFVPEAAAIMRETLAYDCERLEPDDVEGRAVELIERFSIYAAGFGVQV